MGTVYSGQYTMCMCGRSYRQELPTQTPGFHSPAASQRQWTHRFQLNITEAAKTLDRECKEYILFTLLN